MRPPLIDVPKPELAGPQIVFFHFDGHPTPAEFFGDHAESVGAGEGIGQRKQTGFEIRRD